MNMLARASGVAAERGLTIISGILAPSYMILRAPRRRWLSYGSSRDLVGQQPDSQAEEIGLVPAQDDPEILGRAEGRSTGAGRPHDPLALPCSRTGRHLAPPFQAGPPADAPQVVHDRGEDVGLVGPDVHAAVAVAVGGIGQEARGNELALPHRAGPRALHGVQPDMALRHDLEGSDQLAAEELRAKAVVGERGQCGDDLEVAQPRAVVAL